jgi:hypothetical protein
VLLVAGLVFSDPARRRKIVSLLPWIIAAYAITVGLSSWYIYELLKAPAYEKYVGLYQYPTDILSFVIPNPPTWLGGAAFAPVTAMYVGGAGEVLSYVSFPMILLALRFIFTRWGKPAVKALTVTLIATIGWILGRHLQVAGHSTIWLPYSLLGRLPIFNDVMQGRVALALTLLCAVILAMWLARPASVGMQVLRYSCGALAVVCVIPNLLNHGSGVWTNPTFFSTSMYKHYLRQGENIMPITWGGFSESPMWQGEDHFYWRMANGYFMYPPPVGWRNQLTNDLWYDIPKAGDGPLLRRFVIQRHVADVVVQQSELARWSPTLAQAGLHATVTVGGVTLYRVPSSWARRVQKDVVSTSHSGE